MPETPVGKKLGLKPGRNVLLIGTPNGYPAALGELPEGARLLAEAGGPSDCVLLFVRSRSELSRLGRSAVTQVAPGGLLWVCYPKLSSREAGDLKRESVWEAMAPTGWRPVAQVALDETWSALRFRPEADVKPSGRARK